MKKIIILAAILSFLCLISPSNTFAQANKFGIHILEPSDLSQAVNLTNSSGGDWGWVTIVIREDDMNFDKWQDFMDNCRQNHLIPIVRLATHLENDYWTKPTFNDVEKWTEFLNRLNWPVSDKYLIIFNEPNHKNEWGGEINPREYAKILSVFADKIHLLNNGFWVLNAGLDLAAPNGNETMEAFRFMQEMNWEVPGIFEKIDGWSSHSYPNHGYLGKPWQTGKTSIKGYEWELGILQNEFKLEKKLPVFITETGWPKKIAGLTSSRNYYDQETVAEYLQYSYENVWLKDNRVLVITPFLLNYPQDPFYIFCWVDKEGKAFPQYTKIQELKKTSVWPNQLEKFEIISIVLPPFMPTQTEYTGTLTVKNAGQSIMNEKEPIKFFPIKQDGIKITTLVTADKRLIKPGETLSFDFGIRTSTISGEFLVGWEKLNNYSLKVFPKSIIAKVEYGFWKITKLKIQEMFYKISNSFK